MKLVSLKATPMVPWFDSIDLFREIGIFNLNEKGVFVIAEYFGEKEWENEVDPEQVLEAEELKVFRIDIPEKVKVGEIFKVKGGFHQDGEYILLIGKIPVTIQVIDRVFEKDIKIDQAGSYSVTVSNTPSVEKNIFITL